MVYTIINGVFVELESITEIQISVKMYRSANNQTTPKLRKTEEDDITTNIIREVLENVIKRRG